MRGIYWLASYPKSGNTWLRALLTNYRGDSEEPANINDLEASWTAVLRELFDDCVGIESSELTLNQIEHYRPLVYESVAETNDEPIFLKIHDAYTYNCESRPVFSERATAGVIYLVRNPLDVAVSYAHHRDEPVDDTIRVMNRPDAMMAGADGVQLPQKLLSWSAHICSWVDEPRLRTLIVRYEDLLREPVTCFAEVVRFAGLDRDLRRIRKAVEFSRFERLQAQETAHGFNEKQPTAASFFRRGRSGTWRESLTNIQVRQLINDHHEVMRRFGYLSPSNSILC